MAKAQQSQHEEAEFRAELTNSLLGPKPGMQAQALQLLACERATLTLLTLYTEVQAQGHHKQSRPFETNAPWLCLAVDHLFLPGS